MTDVPVPPTDVMIPEFDPNDILMAQALFGQAINANPEALRVINTFGPVLFAGILYTLCEDYAEANGDPENLVPRNSPLEAEELAIGIVRGVARAMSRDALDTLDEEVQSDTDIDPV